MMLPFVVRYLACDVKHKSWFEHKCVLFSRTIGSVTSKNTIFIIYKKKFWIKVSKKRLFNFEKGSTVEDWQALA